MSTDGCTPQFASTRGSAHQNISSTTQTHRRQENHPRRGKNTPAIGAVVEAYVIGLILGAVVFAMGATYTLGMIFPIMLPYAAPQLLKYYSTYY